jgi:hypothetical protein
VPGPRRVELPPPRQIRVAPMPTVVVQ